MEDDQTITQQEDGGNLMSQQFTTFSLLRFAFPTIFMMVFSGLYTIIDTMFVARFVNTYALSSINIVTPVINIIVGSGGMLATGGSAIVARKMGDGRMQEARRDFTLIIISAVILGAVIAFLGLLFLEPIIRELGASDILLPYAKEYLAILLIFAPANILQVVFANLFVTAGKPALGMGLGLAAGLTNTLFDFIFIVWLQMGISGAALATSMGYMIPASAGVIFFLRNKKGTLHFTKPHFNIRVLTESCLNGSSEMVSQLSAAVTTFLFNITMMRLLGEDGVAAITIMIYSQFLLTTLYIGFTMGVAPVFSYNYGSGNTVQLKHMFKICVRIISVASVSIFAVSMVCGPYLVGIFAEAGSEVYRVARTGFGIFPLSFLFCGFNISASALFTALSNGKVSAAISFLRTFVFLSIGIIVLPLFLNETGVWLAVPIAELITLVITIYFICRYRRRYQYY